MLKSYHPTFPPIGNLLLGQIGLRLDWKDIQTFEQLAIQADRVRELYDELNIRIAQLSTLSDLLDYAKQVSEEWAQGAAQTPASMARLITVLRVIDAIIAAGKSPAAIPCLHRVARKPVDLGQGGESQGKDALWELSLHKQLRDNGIETRFDEPDLIASLPSGELPIACKKIYSASNLSAQMGKGAKQLRPFDGAGLIALNIDDLYQADPSRNAKTWADAISLSEADSLFHVYINNFLANYQDKIRPYLAEKKCAGVLVSLSFPVDVHNLSPRFIRHTQTIVWAWPDGQTESTVARLSELRSKLGRRATAR